MTKSYYRWLVLITVSLGTFMATLDGGIVNVALPKIAYSLETNLTILQWVITAYLLTLTSLLPIFGRLGDLLGRKNIYSCGFLVYSLGSLFCAASPTVNLLVVSRVVQAIGSSMLMANGMGLITFAFPAKERGKALGLIGTVVAIGSLAGPMTGGLIISFFHWSAIFLVKLPIGLLGFVASQYFLKKETTPSSKRYFDYTGAFLFILGMVAFLLGISEGSKWGWSTPFTLTPLLLGVVLLTLFFHNETKVPEPVIELKLFKNKVFLFGNLAAGASSFSIFCVMILMPFYLDQVLHYSSTKIGLMMTPFPLAMALISPLSGNLSDKLGPMLLSTFGLGLKTAGLLSMLYLSETSSSLDIITRMLVLGTGTGLFQSPNNSSILGTVPPTKLGLAGSINSLIRNVGMVMGIAFSVSVFTTRLKSASFLVALDYVFMLATGISALGFLFSALRPNSLKVEKDRL